MLIVVDLSLILKQIVVLSIKVINIVNYTLAEIQTVEATSVPCDTLLGREHCHFGSSNCRKQCSQLVTGVPFSGKCIWSRFGRECYCVFKGCGKPCGWRYSGEHCPRINSLDHIFCRHRCKSMGARTGRCVAHGPGTPYSCDCNYGTC